MDVLVIEGDFPFWRGFVVEEWKRLPVRTLLLSRAPSLWRRGDWHELERLPMNGATLDADALRALARRLGAPRGACTMLEPAVGTTLEVQRALGLPELSTRTPRDLRNKAAMVEIMEGGGLAAPRTCYGLEPQSLGQRARRELSLPVVVKPAELAGKAGVRLVRESGELDSAIDSAFAETLPFAIDGAPTSVVELFHCERGVLVQEFVDGPEYSVEGWASGGHPHVVAVTEKITSGPPLFEELGHVQPARLTANDESAVRAYAEAAARAFGLVHCAFHLELRLAARGPVIMEINCRIAGDMIGRLMELRTGMNVGDTLMRLATGREAAPPPRSVGAAGVRMAVVGAGGVVRRLEAPTLRGDREAAVFELGAGSEVHAPKPGGVSRLGYYLVAAETREEVEARLCELAAQTRVELEPAGAASA